MLFICRSLWGKTGLVFVANRLAEVVITGAVDEDHQHRPGNEEKSQRPERVNLRPDDEGSITCGEPGDFQVDGGGLEIWSQDC